MWKQVRPFNPDKAGTIKYLCLANTRKGYGIPPKYASAWDAWQHNQKHTDALPKDVAVPVFWELWLKLDGDTVMKNYGHIAVSMPDGRVWTDGRYYSNIDTLNRYYLSGRGRYVGWGESVNDVQIIKEDTVKLTRKQVGRLIFTLWGRDAKEDELQAYTQREAGDLVKRLIDDPQTTKQISNLLSQKSAVQRFKEKVVDTINKLKP